MLRGDWTYHHEKWKENYKCIFIIMLAKKVCAEQKSNKNSSNYTKPNASNLLLTDFRQGFTFYLFSGTYFHISNKFQFYTLCTSQLPFLPGTGSWWYFTKIRRPSWWPGDRCLQKNRHYFGKELCRDFGKSHHGYFRRS